MVFDNTVNWNKHLTNMLSITVVSYNIGILRLYDSMMLSYKVDFLTLNYIMLSYNIENQSMIQQYLIQFGRINLQYQHYTRYYCITVVPLIPAGRYGDW